MISKTTLKLKKAKKAFKETTKKVKKATGYQITYGTQADLSGAKVKKTKKTSMTVKKLAAKTLYYVQAAPYKKISGKIYAGQPVQKKVKTK